MSLSFILVLFDEWSLHVLQIQPAIVYNHIHTPLLTKVYDDHPQM